MDVSLKASEKVAMEDNRYPCRAHTQKSQWTLINEKIINLKLNVTLLRT